MRAAWLDRLSGQHLGQDARVQMQRLSPTSALQVSFTLQLLKYSQFVETARVHACGVHAQTRAAWSPNLQHEIR